MNNFALGNSVRNLKKLYPNADIRTGLAIHGSSVQWPNRSLKSGSKKI